MKTRVCISMSCIAVLVLFLSSCSGSQEASGQETNSINALRIERSSDDKFLTSAENELIRQCMEKNGFNFAVSIPNDYAAVSAETSKQTPEYRQVHGYGIGEGLATGSKEEVPQSEKENQKIRDGLSAQQKINYDKTLFGSGRNDVTVTLPSGTVISVPGDGCAADARKEIYLDLEEWLTLSATVNNLRSELSKRIDGDSKLSKAEEKWNDCMEKAGVRVASRKELIETITQSYEGKAPNSDQWTVTFAEEKRLASVDSACSVETGLDDTYNKIERKHELEVLQDRESEITGYRELQAEAVNRAKSLVSNASLGSVQ